ncbi:uncharacterized protein LOC125026625 [Penaeus chinensis]|uniref:uncharacterized protein LOC125026625 n=1 Tax=Penaeus chinensis TaxID=139456 RepID=UPI001FB5ADED|nr:uncharacterized protein LOC125026625 [Penaeus chinensis]
MKGPCVRVFVTLASATAFLLSILTPTAHAQEPSVSSKWRDFLKTSKNDIDIEKMFPKLVMTNMGNEGSRQGCKETFNLDAGDGALLFSDNDGTKAKCSYSVKAPAGAMIDVVCPQFNLNPAGCGSEKMILKISGAKPATFCGDEGPNGRVPANSLTIIYKRKALGPNECSGGFLCAVFATDE